MNSHHFIAPPPKIAASSKSESAIASPLYDSAINTLLPLAAAQPNTKPPHYIITREPDAGKNYEVCICAKPEAAAASAAMVEVSVSVTLLAQTMHNRLIILPPPSTRDDHLQTLMPPIFISMIILVELE